MLGDVAPTNVFALVVGVAAHPRDAFPPLPNASADAARVFELLKRGSVPPENIQYFSTGHADVAHGQPESASVWKSVLDDLANKDAELLVIYWSGHGFWQGQRDRRVIFSDTTRRNLLNLDVNGLVQYLRSSDCRAAQAIVIVDACAEFFRGGHYRSLPDHAFPDATTRTEASGRVKPVFVLFSSGLGQLSYAVEPTHPEHPTSRFCHEFCSVLPTEESLSQSIDTVATKLRDKFSAEYDGQMPLFWAEDWDGRDLVTPAILITDALYSGESKPGPEEILRQRTLAWQLTDDSRHLMKPWETVQVTRWLLFHRPELEASQKNLYRRSLERLVRAPAVVASLVLGIAFVSWLCISAMWLSERIQAQNNVAEIVESANFLVRFAAVPFLWNAATESTETLDLDLRQRAAGRRANAALGLFVLGSRDGAENLLSGPDRSDGYYDPAARTSAIQNAISPAGIQPARILELLHEESLPARAKQACILALGHEQIGRDTFPDFSVDDFEKTLLSLYEQDDDPGVHAASLWVLLTKDCFRNRRVKRLLQEAHSRCRDQGISRLANLGGEFGWFVDRSSGLTMIVLLAKGNRCLLGDRDQQDETSQYFPQETTLLESYMISMAELSPLSSPSPDAEEYDFLALPHSGLNRPQAEDQCQRLTQQSSLPPETVVEIGSRRFSVGPYALPGEVQWEYACRGGSRSAYSFGDKSGANKRILGRYATLYPGRQETKIPLGGMPNDFGLFDMHGGVAEWMKEDFSVTYPPNPERPRTGSDLGVLRGGNGRRVQDAKDLRTFARFSRDVDRGIASSYAIGLRPVRVLSEVPPAIE